MENLAKRIKGSYLGRRNPQQVLGQIPMIKFVQKSIDTPKSIKDDYIKIARRLLVISPTSGAVYKSVFRAAWSLRKDSIFINLHDYFSLKDDGVHNVPDMITNAVSKVRTNVIYWSCWDRTISNVIVPNDVRVFITMPTLAYLKKSYGDDQDTIVYEGFKSLVMLHDCLIGLKKLAPKYISILKVGADNETWEPLGSPQTLHYIEDLFKSLSHDNNQDSSILI